MSFAFQRIVFFALLFGMTAYAIAAAVILQLNEGVGLAVETGELLATPALVLGAVTAVMAVVLRLFIRARAEGLSGNERIAARFSSVMVPLALLEGACLFATTVWMLCGDAVPSLAVALVLLAISISIVPFSDPDAR